MSALATVRRLAALTAAALLAGCTSQSGGDAAPRSAGSVAAAATPITPTTPAATTGAPSVATPSATPTATPAAAPTARVDPVSLEALTRKRYDGRGLRLGRVLQRTADFTRYEASYLSGRLRITATLHVPTGEGSFPVMVLAHGHIGLDIYTTGRGMRREQDYLARAGYAVLHVDYRNHAASSKDPRADIDLRLGYTEDVINAVLAVKGATLATLDGSRVGVFGRSMGGGVVYNLLEVQPGLVQAAVAYAPVSSDTVDNFERWMRRDPSGIAAAVVRAHGEPATNPAFWRGVSPRGYVDRITEPLLIQHGTADDTCPIAWTRETVAAMTKAGTDVELVTWPGEGHAFGPRFVDSMKKTVAFLDEHVKNA